MAFVIELFLNSGVYSKFSGVQWSAVESAVVQCSGTVQWCSAVVQCSGAVQWCSGD